MTTPSLLDDFLSGWAARGWPITDTARLRMGPDGDGEGEGEGGEGGEGTGEEGGGSGEDTTDWKAEAERLKQESRKHEDRWKKNAKELADLKKAGLPDSEKALSEAEDRGRKAALLEAGQRLAGAEIKAALSGVVPDPAAIVEDLNLAKYLTDDGEVDDDKVKALKAKYETQFPKTATRVQGSADGGSQGGSGDKPKQLTRADLKSMSPEAIEKAEAAGQLADLLSGKAT